MVRNILAVVGALVAGTVGIMAVQYLNTMLYPPPPGLDFNIPEQAAQIVAQLPLAALLMVELSYVVGSLLCGAVVGWLARGHVTRLALGLGIFFTVMNVLNLIQIPHPLWMAVLTMVTFIPVVWVAARWSAARWGAGV